MASKAELRRWLHAQRLAMPDGDRRLAGRRLAERGLAWASALSIPASRSAPSAPAEPPSPFPAGEPPSFAVGEPPSSSTPSRAPGRIAAYLSVGTEPSTLPLMALLVEHGYEVLVPVCESGFRLQWVRWVPGIELRRSPWAPVDEPVGRRLPLDIMEQVAGILLPALAADTDGNRLGKGGGYYDRFLATLPGLRQRPTTAAVVFEHELLEPGRIEVDELDAPVGGVLTPQRYVAVPESGN